LAVLPDWLTYFFQFKSYAVLFVAAAAATALLTPLYVLLARRVGLVDRPGGRKQHPRATATMGGLVIFLVVFAGVAAAVRLDNLVGDILRAQSRFVYGIMVCTACMIALGVVDDVRSVPAKVKLLVQGIVALAAVLLGFQIEAVTIPGYESITLPAIVGALLSLVWIVGITNAVNLSDGIDGLAVGICLLASGVNALVAIWLGNHYMTVLMALLAGALLGFLRWNFHPARVFLGDTGSLALGMFLALASLKSAQKAHTIVMILVPLFALGYPIFDTLLAVARRVIRGQPLLTSDRDHIHHRLLDRGRSPTAAAIQIYAASVLVSLVCIAAATANHFVLGIAVAGVGVLALFCVRVLGYLEWGGWQHRWTGRRETKVLHAAAHLARLKIEQSEDATDMVRALGILAPEVDCVRIDLNLDARTHTWNGSDDPEADAGGEQFDIALGDERGVRFVFRSGRSPSQERRHVIEDVCIQLAARIE
jgi:UDP-GlcNAc:undecaprenyl-phosphate GlcNAc-1-phosphate transferase